MELRFILEHAEASVETARKMFNAGDRERAIYLLENLGDWITQRIVEGVTEPPNIDVKPTKP